MFLKEKINQQGYEFSENEKAYIKNVTCKIEYEEIGEEYVVSFVYFIRLNDEENKIEMSGCVPYSSTREYVMNEIEANVWQEMFEKYKQDLSLLEGKQNEELLYYNN